MFKINGEGYEIEQAYIDALLDEEEERLMFGVEISGKQADDRTLPSITSDTLLKTGKHEIRKWQDIAGRVVEWGKYSKNVRKPYARFYNYYKNTFRSNFIYNAKIEFKAIDSKIFIKVQGLCDSKFNGTEIKTLSLKIETEVVFGWISTGAHITEELARNKLNPYLDADNFDYSVSPLKLSNGSVDMGRFDLKNENNEYRIF
ncbi:MAG: hypothetical protein LBK58_01835 [Prevotellaceae bacterium]|jgi:hypothetical protein|nr:hypothetical protein [Prevotellaceae bacterium]